MIAICQEIANTENMGSLIRACAAFGADALVLGERRCDPYFRQSVRVSMGTVFSLPIVRSENLLKDLDDLRERHAVQTIAAVVDERAENLSDLKVTNRMAAVFGNERKAWIPKPSPTASAASPFP